MLSPRGAHCCKIVSMARHGPHQAIALLRRVPVLRLALNLVITALIVVLFVVVLELLTLVIRLASGFVAVGALFGYLAAGVGVLIGTMGSGALLKSAEARGRLLYRFAVIASATGLALFLTVAARGAILVYAGMPTIASALGPGYIAIGAGGLVTGVAAACIAIATRGGAPASPSERARPRG